MARLFVAASPPDEVLDRVAALDRPEAGGVRWTRRDQWHVTLRFLGEAEVDEAAEALAGLVASPCEAVVGPAVIRLGRGVLCLPVAGLDEAAASVGEVTAAVGGPPGDRPFRGHLTLARLRDRARPPRAVIGTPFSDRFRVDEVALVRSHLGDGPARHDTIATFPLG